MIVKSYGIFWREDRVKWGGPGNGNAGALIGTAPRHPGVDFRDQTGIYALYAEYELVYVGQARANLFRRLRQHRADHLSERWDRFSWFGTRGVTAQHVLARSNLRVHDNIPGALDVLEAIATTIAEPRLNLQQGRWNNVTQFFQFYEDGD